MRIITHKSLVELILTAFALQDFEMVLFFRRNKIPIF